MVLPVPWCLVLPVKRLAVAKSRLAGPYAGQRADLALAFALDTAAAALRSRDVVGLVAVTDEPRAAEALREQGAYVVTDRPGGGLNPALSHGAAQARLEFPSCSLGALSADLPALKPSELDMVLELADAHDRAFVRDHAGTGTTLLLARADQWLQPAFGDGSAERHARAGHADLSWLGVPGLRSDVDTAADLEHAMRLGVGHHTAECLRIGRGLG